MPTPLTRREFLHHGVALVSTAATVPAFLHTSALAVTDPDSAVASKPGVPDHRVLVVVQLSGGNDGLNTVIPVGEKAYYDGRPTIAIAARDALGLDERKGVGLHPSLTGLKGLFDEGLAAVVQGVGYPNPNRSHFASMDIWHAGDTLDGSNAGVPKGTGWIGRSLDGKGGGDASAAPLDSTACVCIGDEAPIAAQGRRFAPVAFESAALFRWTGQDLHPALAGPYDQINRGGVLGSAPATGAAAFVQRTALDAQLASDRIRAAVANKPVTSFPNGSLANQLRMVAAMIRAELPTRVYYVAQGGYDTHAGQPNRHANLLAELGNALAAFQTEMRAIGAAERVLTMTFSEFGRRVRQNASAGTDHGAAGPMFLVGPTVRPGVLSDHPSLTRLDNGDLAHTVDFRSVYATVIDQWLGADSTAVLGRRFAAARVLKA